MPMAREEVLLTQDFLTLELEHWVPNQNHDYIND